MKAITILLCKLLAFVGGLIGKGSSLPGSVALKLCPNILSQLTLPKYVVAVTGSNGKTSTVEMLANILISSGKDVIWNKEGSNQIEGVTTLLLKNADLSGRVHGDVVLLESDERYARHSFKHIKPSHFVITNLYRDQLTRNVHPFNIYHILHDAVDLIPDAQLVLNADDPIVRNFGWNRDNVIYFGMDRNDLSGDHSDALYNDCHYCPICKQEMKYDHFHYAHLGKYHCSACDYGRPDTVYSVDSMDLANNRITVNGHPIHLEFSSKYYVYNICAAFSAASLLGIPGEHSAAVLSEFVMQNGRNVRFTAGNNHGLLITSKHENSTSYNQSLGYVAMQPERSTLVIIVDAISRKYYTSETSWLWDISFEILKDSNVARVILSGKYAYDLAVRMELAGITNAEIIVEPNLDKMGQLLQEPTDKIYAVTCFSDKEKLFAQVNVQSPTAK